MVPGSVLEMEQVPVVSLYFLSCSNRSSQVFSHCVWKFHVKSSLSSLATFSSSSLPCDHDAASIAITTTTTTTTRHKVRIVRNDRGHSGSDGGVVVYRSLPLPHLCNPRPEPGVLLPLLRHLGMAEPAG
jgi:hypothetical protein